MTTTLEKQVQAAATVLQAQNTTLTSEQATELAKAVMAATADDNEKAPAPAPKPAGPLPMPRHDPKTDVFAYGRELAKWNAEVQTSYHPPINENVERARARLVELRNVSDNESAAFKVQRALEREKLIEIIYGQNGGARL